MRLGWMDVKELSFRNLLCLEEFQVNILPRVKLPEKEFAIALKANPEVEWYLRKNSSGIDKWLDQVLDHAEDIETVDEQVIRDSEIAIMENINDWMVFIHDPSVYDTLEFLGWDSDELTDVANFRNKRVADIGAGTGRLTFVAADTARTIYAIEPVHLLRKYLKQKALKNGFDNIYAVSGLIEDIPFEDNFFDITMGGHVYGDLIEAEYAQMERVTKKGGQIILCPGNNNKDNHIHHFLLRQGFEWKAFEEPKDGMKRKYWKTV